MAYRYGDRNQAQMFPANIQDYVDEDAPVRAYDEFVNVLDLDGLGINMNTNKVGCPQYDPRTMLKLLVYGYSYGVRSSRKLERETHYNLSFIWLMGGMKPDYKTIAEFRRKNKTALKKVLKQCAWLCLQLDLIVGNTLFIDGTKIRANASIKNSIDKQKGEKMLKGLNDRIEKILSECDEMDEKEKGQGSYVAMQEELKNSEKRKEKIKKIVEELEKSNNDKETQKNEKESKKQSINTVDADCTRIKGRQGSHAGYNAQIAVDEKNGLIASSDVVNENPDKNQFSRQVEQVKENLEKECEIACADCGYASVEKLREADEKGVRVIVPSQRQTEEERRPVGEFDLSAFSTGRQNSF